MRRDYDDERQVSGGGVRLALACVGFAAAALTLYGFIMQPSTGVLGAIWTALHGLSGSLSPLLAIMLVWLGLRLLASARGHGVGIVRGCCELLLFLLGFAAVHVFSARTIIEGRMQLNNYANFIHKSYLYGSGGGAMGALLGYFLYDFLGSGGGLAICIVLMLLCCFGTGHAQRLLGAIRERNAGREPREDVRARAQERQERARYNAQGYERRMPSAPPRQNPSMQRPPQKRRDEQDALFEVRQARKSAARREDDSMRIPTRHEDESMRIPDAGNRQRKPAASMRPVRTGGRALYKETVEQAAEPQGSSRGVDIPRPLSELRQEHGMPEPKSLLEDEYTMERKKRGPIEVIDIPEKVPVRGKPKPEDDFFTVHEDEEIIEEAEDEEEEIKIEVKPAASKPKKRVSEGVRTLDNDKSTQDEDEAPFDLPHVHEKQEKSDEDEIYNYPPIDLLATGERECTTQAHRDADARKAQRLIDILMSFGIETRLVGIAHGPAVTRFELQPAPGVKVSRITGLADDIALGLAALTVRIEAPIPGKAAVGVEIPNEKVEAVHLRDVLESAEARKHPSRVAVALGKDNSGKYIVADIAKMPHVLIAGQTGSGKSVCINSIIASILYRATPDEVRMILIDPKVVELSIYNEIPHLIAPVVTDPSKASSALQWAVAEMSTRYKTFAENGVRDIKGYNKKLPKGQKPMPQMVIVIDELADLMMVCPGEVEESICRLAQLARAAGMHLVIATQRPSVNVITGVIKANIPSRIAFCVSSQVDSRTIIDHSGAEKLLGNGDMLFVPSGTNKAVRVQGSWVSDEEVNEIVSYIKASSDVAYDEDVVERIESAVHSDAEREDEAQEYDARLPEAVEIVIEAGQASTSMLQRRMRVGYARAGRLIDEMERRGIVSEADGSKPRNVLINREQFQRLFAEDEE